MLRFLILENLSYSVQINLKLYIMTLRVCLDVPWNLNDRPTTQN